MLSIQCNNLFISWLKISRVRMHFSNGNKKWHEKYYLHILFLSEESYWLLNWVEIHQNVQNNMKLLPFIKYCTTSRNSCLLVSRIGHHLLYQMRKFSVNKCWKMNIKICSHHEWKLVVSACIFCIFTKRDIENDTFMSFFLQLEKSCLLCFWSENHQFSQMRIFLLVVVEILWDQLITSWINDRTVPCPRAIV
jgi:hypothetical protein